MKLGTLLATTLGTTLAIGLVTGCGSSRGGTESDVPGVTDDVVTLGVTAPLSGPGSSYSDATKAMDAYFRKVNADGGVNGREIELNIRDDAYDPARTVTETSRLIKSDKVFALVGGVGGATQSSVAESSSQAGVPAILLNTGLDTLVGPVKPYVSIMRPTYGIEMGSWVEYIKTNHAGQKVGVLYQNDDSGKVAVKVLSDALGKDAIASEGFDVTDADVSTQITALRQSGAEVLFFASSPKFSSLGLLATDRLGWEVPTLVISVGFDENVIETAGGAAEGAVTAAAVRSFLDEDDPFVKEANDVVREYGEGLTPNKETMIGVATAMVFVSILEEAGENLDRESLMEAHDSISLDEGPWYGTVELSADDRVALGCLQFVQVADSATTSVDEPQCS